MKIRILAITHPGIERANNEDAFIVCPDLDQHEWTHVETPNYIPLGKYGAIMVVADGMGGANAGEVASEIAVTSVRDVFTREHVAEALDTDSCEKLIRKAVEYADEAINKRIWTDPSTSGMGTTIVVCWIVNNVAYVGWSGDSRGYVFNENDGIKQLTKDHSLVQELIDKGEITEEEAFTHPDNNIITKGLGDVGSLPSPDVIKYPLQPDDIILLCSDGLCGYCSNKEIEGVLVKSNRNVKKCQRELMKLALNAGGYDNICIAIASLISEERKRTFNEMLLRLKHLFR